MKRWQKPGPVSCTLIKQSSFIVVPRSPLFSQKLKEQAAAKLQPSCQLDKSQFISVTRQQGPSSSQARGGGAVETCSWHSLCQRGPLARVIPSAVVYLPVCFMQTQVGSTCAISLEKGIKSNHSLAIA